MDPLSITASSIAVVTVCSQVVSLVAKWTIGVREIDSTLKNLETEVIALSTVVTSVKETFERPELSAVVASHSETRLWQTLGGSLNTCKRSTRRLKRMLKDLNGGVENDGIWNRGTRLTRFKSKKDEIAEQLRSIQSYKATIQVALQCASV